MIDPLTDPVRLQVLRSTRLLGHEEDAEFDRVTGLAARLLGVPVCLVSLVEEDRQVFVGACGLSPSLDAVRETPLSHSICQHAVRERRPVVIGDAAADFRKAANRAARDLGVAAYLGFPLIGPDGHVFGAFCAIDRQPREWSEDDIEMMRDFTAIVAGQIELRVVRARERSALDVAIHDLKSPLAGMKMVADILTEQLGKLPSDLQPLVESLAESGDHALRLIGSLASRDEAESSAGCRDLGEVLNLLLDRHQPIASEKGLEIRLSNPAGSVALRVAEWVVEQVAENLLSNAIKFTPEGRTIRISTRREDNHGVFEVADEGPGFSVEDLPWIFRRYSRMSARPTGGEASTGLGLSIVKRLVDERGGSVKLVSAPGEGAVFRVCFPLADD